MIISDLEGWEDFTEEVAFERDFDRGGWAFQAGMSRGKGPEAWRY